MTGRTALLTAGIAAGAVLVGLFASGCGGAKTLGETETKQLLRQLPYRFAFRDVAVPDGASGAVAGTAYGRHGTVLGFGVSLGTGGDAVSLGPESDLADATGGETFRVTGGEMLVNGRKLRVSPRIKTRAQWAEANRMHVAIEEKLCQATEGGACAI